MTAISSWPISENVKWTHTAAPREEFVCHLGRTEEQVFGFKPKHIQEGAVFRLAELQHGCSGDNFGNVCLQQVRVGRLFLREQSQAAQQQVAPAPAAPDPHMPDHKGRRSRRS